MRELLASIAHPSHYAGIEDGIYKKDPATLRFRIALAFPDLYEVGMSYLGQKILYACVNEHEGWYAERVMAPEKATGDLLRQTGTPLATLETDTPLKELDCIGFSITHELCYTNVLYMLDLAKIPLTYSERRTLYPSCPLVIAGGGALCGAEPLAPFVDLMLLGDGEEMLPKLLQLFEACKETHATLDDILAQAANLPGVYVPSLFTANNGHLLPSKPGYRPRRTLVGDLNAVPYPVRQVVPIGAVHNRLSVEIARGCTRGCRFCQAGIVYRPVRERSVDNITDIVTRALPATGFDELSFLSLSTGDYSALKALSHTTFDLCKREQIAFSLPSQRVGSIDESIFARIADIRRTGMTLAPEAGSQRLRDVINKGITEEQVLLHAKKLVEYGWSLVKLYFMIGLPTETDDDLTAIYDLACKVRTAAGRPKLQVTVAISPFVPKPFTPFQWAEQASCETISQKIGLLRSLFRNKKGLTLRWHEPAVSTLEGILSRGGRELAPVVAYAYRQGAIFASWMEHFRLEPWLEGFRAEGLDPNHYLRSRSLTEELPWDHLDVGVHKEFLQKEWEKALAGRTTSDCRYDHCHGCGVCDEQIANRLCRPTRDQDEPSPQEHHTTEAATHRATNLITKAVHYRIWHTKCGQSAYVSQLELQSIVTRALRRAHVPIAFSNGFHPMPLLSFGRALPVGVESTAEWFSISLQTLWEKERVCAALAPYLPEGLAITGIEEVAKKDRTLLAIEEHYLLQSTDQAACAQALRDTLAMETRMATISGKKGSKTIDIRPFLCKIEEEANGISLVTSWKEGYISPVTLLREILGPSRDFRLKKTRQRLDRVYP